jgi:hypothetical protein
LIKAKFEVLILNLGHENSDFAIFILPSLLL